MKAIDNQELRKSPLMAHLMDSLNRGEDIGHYGRLVFAMVARHFMEKGEVVAALASDRDFSEEQAAGLVDQVDERDYNPPNRGRILEWMGKQGFPICPDADDPSGCNVYRELNFPDEVYKHISGYRQERAEAHNHV